MRVGYYLNSVLPIFIALAIFYRGLEFFGGRAHDAEDRLLGQSPNTVAAVGPDPDAASAVSQHLTCCKLDALAAFPLVDPPVQERL